MRVLEAYKNIDSVPPRLSLSDLKKYLLLLHLLSLLTQDTRLGLAIRGHQDSGLTFSINTPERLQYRGPYSRCSGAFGKTGAQHHRRAIFISCNMRILTRRWW